MTPPELPLDGGFRRYEALRAALDLIDQGLSLIDEDLRFIAWNKTFLRLLNFPPEMGYVGATFESFIRFNAERGEYGTDDPQAYIDERVRLARTFVPHEFERTRPDGTVLHVRGIPVPGHGFVTLYSDITAQRTAERQIREQNASLETRVAERTAELKRGEAQMRLITDSIPALIAYFDRNRVYRYINRGYHDWFGIDTANPGAANAEEFLGAGAYGGNHHQVERALAGEAMTFEYETTIKGDQKVIARTTLIPEIEIDATVAGCFELTFDITEQRRAHEMLVQAQKMEALGQLTGGLAHDFNNILTVILGNLGALAEARAHDPTVTEFLEPAVEAARRGAELIKALLSFSRSHPIEPVTTDVALLIASVGRMVRRSLPDTLQLDVRRDETALWAWIDGDQLQNTLLNLIFNARDATAADGRIAVDGCVQVLDEAGAADLQIEPGRYVRIDVVDNGSGMDELTRARIFEPFFTTKRSGQGTGLGLAMVYGFVRQSGGAICVRSAIGQGTTVSLWLPALGDPGEQAIEPARDEARGDLGLALLVEDDPGVRKVVRRSLLELGYAVIEAENGGEALQILEQTPGIGLLLTDVVMPGDIDGRRLAVHARERFGIARVVLMSGFAPGPEHPTGIPMLAKPFTKSQLSAVLEDDGA